MLKNSKKCQDVNRYISKEKEISRKKKKSLEKKAPIKSMYLMHDNLSESNLMKAISDHTF